MKTAERVQKTQAKIKALRLPIAMLVERTKTPFAERMQLMRKHLADCWAWIEYYKQWRTAHFP